MNWLSTKKAGAAIFVVFMAGCLEVSVEIPDRTAPRLLSTVPVDAEINVPVNRSITATFDEAMDGSTFDDTTFTLEQGGISIPGAVSVVGSVATLNPTVDLEEDTVFSVRISNNVTDLAGNAMDDNEEWTFTTGSLPDNTAPTVVFTIPDNGDASVATNINVTANFSESMDAATLNVSTFTLFQGATPIPGIISFSGVVATFNPNIDLDANAVFTATITSGAEDLAGNALALDEVWTFTTGDAPDTVEPTVISTIPVDGDINISTGGNIIVVFSEPMDATTINITTLTLRQGATAISGVVSFAGVVATFNPNVSLSANEVFTATITNGAEDLAGNALALDESWTFTTGDAPDIIKPTVDSTVPANGDIDVAINTNLLAIFSEPMDAATLNNSTFTLRQGAAVIPGVVSFAGTVATFSPIIDLDANTLFTATITTGVTDLAGNSMALAETWSFTTGLAPDTTAPTITSTIPLDLEIGVSTGGNIIAVFNEPMDAATINTTTFTLNNGVVNIPCSVTFAGVVATLNPSVELDTNTVFTARVSNNVADLAGNAMVFDEIWTFTTAIGAGPGLVDLGAASDFVILAKSGIDTSVASVIVGDIGVSPASSTAITGFALTLDGTNTFSTSDQITGSVFAADYASPTPGELTVAINDLQAAAVDAAGRILPDFTELGAGDISGLTLAPGLYKWSTGVIINSDITLAGGPDDVWIFQIAGGLTQGSATSVFLSNGAKAKNIFWQSFGAVALDTAAHMEGNILSTTEITLASGSSINGRLLAETAVTLDGSTVTAPAP